MNNSYSRDRSIHLHGSYCGNNFGDLLLLQIFLNWCVEADVTQISFSEQPIKLGRQIRMPNSLPMLRSRSSNFAFIGGGYLGAPTAQTVKYLSVWHFYHVQALLRAAYSAKRIGIFGIGAGPLISGPARYLIKRIVSKATVVGVRDTESQSELENLGVNLSRIVPYTDAALALCQDGLVRRSEQRNRFSDRTFRIGLHLSLTGTDTHLVDAFGSAIRGLHAKNRPVEIVGLVDQNGTSGAVRQSDNFQRISSQMPCAATVHRFTMVDDFLDSIAGCDLLITTKLHVGVVGRCFGIPVLSMPTHLKTPRFYRQIGESDWCLPIKDFELEWLQSRLSKAIGFEKAPFPISNSTPDRALALKGEFVSFCHGTSSLSIKSS